MPIEVHCDDGDILTKGASKYQIGICGFIPGKANVGSKDKSYLVVIPIDWDSGRALMVETSRYAGEIQAAFRGFDTARFLKSMLSGMLFGNEI